MSSPYNRRAILHLAGASVALALAGCAADPDPEGSNGSSNRTAPSTREPITTSDFTFDVSVDEQFTEDHPARIHADLTNTTETTVTLFTGVTPPFTSYLSGSESDENRLVLVPNVPEDENPLDWAGETDPTPTTAENGCWNVIRDVAIEQLGKYTELDQGETSSQQYAVYGYQNEPCLPPDAYRFEDTTTLHRGQPSDDTPTHEAILGFTLTIGEGQSLSIERHDPTVTGT